MQTQSTHTHTRSLECIRGQYAGWYRVAMATHCWKLPKFEIAHAIVIAWENACGMCCRCIASEQTKSRTNDERSEKTTEKAEILLHLTCFLWGALFSLFFKFGGTFCFQIFPEILYLCDFGFVCAFNVLRLSKFGTLSSFC